MNTSNLRISVTVTESGWSDADSDYRQLCADAADFIVNRFGSVEAAAKAQSQALAVFGDWQEFPCGNDEADLIMSGWFDTETQALGFAITQFRDRTGNLIGDVKAGAYIEVSFF